MKASKSLKTSETSCCCRGQDNNVEEIEDFEHVDKLQQLGINAGSHSLTMSHPAFTDCSGSMSALDDLHAAVLC